MSENRWLSRSMATMRSLPSASFFLPCSPSIIPTTRHCNRQPTAPGSSMSASTSTGSPSSAIVDGINPKIVREGHACGQHLFQSKDFLLFVKHIFISATLRCLDHHLQTGLFLSKGGK